MERTVLQNTANVFKKEYIIEAEQVDAAGKVTCGTLARLMQDITTVHMNAEGLSVNSLMEKNLLWVIVCTQSSIYRLPETGEAIEQYSWAGAGKLGMHSRRYAFFTKDGEELLNASSLFLLVDKESRSLSEPTKEILAFPAVTIHGEPKLPKMMQKFPPLVFGKTQEVTESEIDYNGHVNNAVYLDWADSVFDSDFVQERAIKGFWLQYNKEVLMDQTVAMKYSVSDNSVFLKGTVQGSEYFKVRFDF